MADETSPPDAAPVADAVPRDRDAGDPHEVQHLTYRCPHCGATSSISEVLMGDTIDCRRCQKPFQVGVPVAQPVRDEPGAKADFTVDPGGGDTEETVFVTHPAAYRNRPFRTLLAVLGVISGLALVAAGLLGGLGLAFLEPVTAAVGGTVVAAAGGVLALVAAGFLFVWWLKSRYETLTVTSRRTTYRWGIISRDTTEVLHEDVANLQVDQSGFGRLLGVGDLFISSAAQDGLEIRALGIPTPEKPAGIVRDLQ